MIHNLFIIVHASIVKITKVFDQNLFNKLKIQQQHLWGSEEVNTAKLITSLQSIVNFLHCMRGMNRGTYSVHVAPRKRWLNVDNISGLPIGKRNFKIPINQRSKRNQYNRDRTEQFHICIHFAHLKQINKILYECNAFVFQFVLSLCNNVNVSRTGFQLQTEASHNKNSCFIALMMNKQVFCLLRSVD